MHGMKLSSLHLEAFAALAQAGSFSDAARELGVTQSALSQRILNLEGELETTLVIRDRPLVRLTESGEALLSHCQTARALEDDLLRSLHNPDPDHLSGTIRVAGFSSILRSLVIPALAPLLRDHSDLDLEAKSLEIYQVGSALTRGEVDYGFGTEPINRSNVVSTRLGYEEYLLVASKSLPDREVYLDHDSKDQTTAEYFRINAMEEGVPRRFYLGDVYGILQSVELGLGRAVLPRHLIRGNPKIRSLEFENPMWVPVYLYFFRRAVYPKRHHEVVRVIKEIFAANLNQNPSDTP
jgi:DNA-binding transcriptional LysR family regulator